MWATLLQEKSNVLEAKMNALQIVKTQMDVWGGDWQNFIFVTYFPQLTTLFPIFSIHQAYALVRHRFKSWAAL